MAALEHLYDQECSRRSLLRFAAGVAGATVLGGSLGGDQGPPPIYAEELGDLADAARPFLNQDAWAYRPLPRRDQLAVASNPRFREALRRPFEDVIEIVHPGYLLSEAEDVSGEYGNLRSSLLSRSSDPDERRYYDNYSTEAGEQTSDRRLIESVRGHFIGRYGDYLERMEELFARQREAEKRGTDKPMIIHVEERDVYRGRIRREEFMPPENAFIVVTERASPYPVDVVSYRQGWRTIREPQALDALYGWLAQQSPDARFGLAGEKGVHPTVPNLQCVGGVALDLLGRGGFGGIHGMKSLVFPTNPFKIPEPDGTNYYEAAQALYLDTVPALV